MASRATFLGASITNFQTSLGWGSKTSQLTVTLVEDSTNGDNFVPGNVGDPCYFSYNSVSFGGILQSYKKKFGQSGNPIYEVMVVDPREILDGVQLILDDYNGDVSAIPNLYNIYKYWEDTGFGNSLRNDTGMPWAQVLNGYLALEAGKSISFRSNTYTIDFTNILAMWLSGSYRIGGESISMLQLIDEVCAAAGCDYYVTLEAGEIINIYTISRRITPVSGAIDAFVTAQDGVNAKESGMELRNEVTTKFLTGGQQEYFYLAWYAAISGNQNPLLNNVWPYWGTTLDGDIVVGSGVDGSHRLILDTRSVRDNVVGDSYTTDTTELRAALVGQDAWQQFLLDRNDTAGSIHNGKADTLELACSAGNWKDIIEDKTKKEVIGGINIAQFMNLASEAGELSDGDVARINRINHFYDWLSQYASEYYGKQFMVRMPFVSTALESDTNRILLSHEPIQSAYLDSDKLPSAREDGIIPSGEYRFTDDSNKINCYVRFNDNSVSYGSGLYDLSELAEDDYESANGYLFVRAEVDPVPVYVDKSTLSDPRAVIRIPGRVKPKKGTLAKYGLGVLEDVLNDNVTDGPFSPAEFKELAAKPGWDMLFLAREGVSNVPTLVALPVRSNISTYGPWYAVGSNGKVDYEQDESLVPWNYGGYDEMNIVGNAKVLTSMTYEQSNEGGIITVPGVPSKNIGDQIVAQSGYPYITDINVSMGQNGVMTTYYLQQWTPRFGTTTKQQIERFKNQTLTIQRERKKVSLLNQAKSRKNQTSYFLKGKPQKSTDSIKERERASTCGVVMSEVVPVTDSATIFAEVSFSPYYHVLPFLSKNYTRKAMSSLDAIFRPFDVTYSGYIDATTSGVLIPRFKRPVEGASTPTVEDLNPFTEPHDMSAFVAGSSIPINGLAIDSSGIAADPQYRPIGMRLPMVGVGWGYDTDGKPVPADPDNEDEFVANHRRRQDLWKAGPIDIRWNDDRKVWVATGDSIVPVRLIEGYEPKVRSTNRQVFLPGGSGLVSTDTSNFGIVAEEDTAIIFDPYHNLCALSGELFQVVVDHFSWQGIKYEPLAEFGLFRTGVLETDVEPGGSGIVHVSLPNIAGGPAAGIGRTISADFVVYDHLLETGQIMSSGSAVSFHYDKSNYKFYFVSAACSGSLP